MAPKWFDLSKFFRFSPDDVGSFLKNEAVRSNLRQNGDNSKKARPVEHYAYFPTEEGRGSFRDLIVSRGDEVMREDVSAADDGKLLLLFSKVQAPIAIDKETALLEEHARQLGGEYDGWETEVIRQV